MKLLVRNLARSTTEAELKEMFEAFGRVQSCNLVMDQKTGSSKGFGFVEMPKPGEAKAAMKNLNGKDVAGNRIRVKKAEDKPAGKTVTKDKAEAKVPEPKSAWSNKPVKTKPKQDKPKQQRPERPRPEASEPEQPKTRSPVNPWTKNR